MALASSAHARARTRILGSLASLALASVACSHRENLADDPRPATSAVPVPQAAVGARLDLPPPAPSSPAGSPSPSEEPPPSALGPAPVTHDGAIVLSNAGLPQAVVARVVHVNFTRFRLCYQRASASDAELAGWVVVQFVIEPDGSVASAALTAATTMGDPDAAACVVRAFRRLSFPEPESGAIAASYAIYFEPASPSAPSPAPPGVPAPPVLPPPGRR